MEIRKVGILGAGQMGLGIAQAAARAGFETFMAKATPGPLDAQRGKVEKQLQKEVEKGKLTAADHGALLERLRWSTHLHDLADVDLVIESIVEELPTKRDQFGRLDEVVKDNAIFATNTSTLTVAEIAAATKRPERFIGLHFFNPVHAMKLVEVAIADAIETALISVAARIRDDADMRDRINRWLRVAALRAVASRRQEIAAFIRKVVENWDTETLIMRIELQVGRDLQFIRINGTVVGGLVGLLIFSVSRWL